MSTPPTANNATRTTATMSKRVRFTDLLLYWCALKRARAFSWKAERLEGRSSAAVFEGAVLDADCRICERRHRTRGQRRDKGLNDGNKPRQDQRQRRADAGQQPADGQGRDRCDGQLADSAPH